MLTKRTRGYTFVEFLIVALIVGFVILLILNAYNDALRSDRRSFAQRGMITVASLQERWFAKMYQYASKIEEVGGADIGGEYYIFKITQDPCGDTKCFTVTARFKSDKAEDPECDRLTLNHLGVKKAYDRANKDTTAICWKMD